MPPPPADEALVVAAVLGDLDAFGELVMRYRRAVIRIAAAIVGQSAAEDVAQETFLLAFRALPDLDEPERFPAWVSAIARNRSFRWAKREGRARSVEFDDTLAVYLDALASHHDRGKAAAAEIAEGIDQLPDSCKLIMRLKWLDEMSMQQIAAFTGLPLSTVKWRLHEGKRQLKAWYEKNPAPELASALANPRDPAQHIE